MLSFHPDETDHFLTFIYLFEVQQVQTIAESVEGVRRLVTDLL